MTSVTREAWEQVMALSSGINLPLGPNSTDRYLFDPKRLAFFLARYKFASKMLKRCKDIVDVGCGDGMGTLMYVSDTGAEKVTGIDFDAALVDHAKKVLHAALEQGRPDRAARLSFECVDVLDGPMPGATFDGLSSLDVIEHIEERLEHEFIGRLAARMTDNGVAVIGTPNAHARQYASKHSEIGHINNYTPDRLQGSLEQHFRRVFLFSMNDEIVHTGFDKLAHYLIALCVK
ncbi:MAG TPA: class I SAM-dependent methyltransferase [Xanthobacteraceae bacterium]|jgi:2-polyprenyl-3-methyl-5-hydroxy-6-metoxy-1,4-benzoquinol methylase